MAAFDGSNAPTIAVQFYKSGTWTSVTSTDVREIAIKRGRTRPDQKDDAGTSTVVFDNNSGYYDPDYTGASSPWVVSSASILRAGLQMRIVATWSSTDYILFNGYLESNTVNQGFDATASMTFVDGIAFIAKAVAPALSTASFAETAATRVGRMLDYASWSASARSLTGSSSLLATSQNANCMDIINQCASAIAGRFYVSRTGVATLVPLSDKFSRPTQLLFDDSRAANTVEYDALKTTPGTLQVVNQAVINRTGATQYTSTYNPSVTSYGTKTVTLDAPLSSNGSASNLALYLSRKDATPTTLVEQVDFSALALNTLFPDFLATELSDQVSVKRTTVDGRAMQWDLVVEGMNHNITSDSWRVSYMTSAINPYSITI
jgi:hypothetical protein